MLCVSGILRSTRALLHRHASVRSEKPILRKVLRSNPMQPWVLHAVMSVGHEATSFLHVQVGLFGECVPDGKPRAGHPVGVHAGYCVKLAFLKMEPRAGFAKSGVRSVPCPSNGGSFGRPASDTRVGNRLSAATGEAQWGNDYECHRTVTTHSTSSTNASVLLPTEAGIHGQEITRGTRAFSSKFVFFSHSLCSPRW